jgi:hypothetical protein
MYDLLPLSSLLCQHVMLEKRYVRTYKICTACNCIIDETFLCNYGCMFDGLVARPPETVIIRRYNVVEELLDERRV